MSLFISNIASTDGTSEFLEKENQRRKNLRIYNKPEDQSAKPNVFYLNKIISPDIEWVGFMGDDDISYQKKESLQKIYKCLKENKNENLEFVFVFVKQKDQIIPRKYSLIKSLIFFVIDLDIMRC